MKAISVIAALAFAKTVSAGGFDILYQLAKEAGILNSLSCTAGCALNYTNTFSCDGSMGPLDSICEHVDKIIDQMKPCTLKCHDGGDADALESITRALCTDGKYLKPDRHGLIPSLGSVLGGVFGGLL